MVEIYRLYFKEEIPNELFLNYRIIGIFKYRCYIIAIIRRTHNQSITKLTFELASKSIAPVMIHHVDTRHQIRKITNIISREEKNKLLKIVSK